MLNLGDGANTSKPLLPEPLIKNREEPAMIKLTTTIAICLTLLTGSALAASFTPVFSDDFSTFDSSKFELQQDAAYNAAESAVYLVPAAGYKEGALNYKNLLENVWLKTTFDFSISGGTNEGGTAFLYGDAFLTFPSYGTGTPVISQMTRGFRFDFRTRNYNALHLFSIIDGVQTTVATVNIVPDLRNSIYTAEALYQNGILSVWLENASIGYAKTLLLSENVSGFAPSVGYTMLHGYTGTRYDNHIIHSWSLDTAPIPEPSLIVMALGFVLKRKAWSKK